MTPKFSNIFTDEAVLDIQNNNAITESSDQSERVLNLDVGYGPWAIGVALGFNWQLWRTFSLRAGFRRDQASDADSQVSLRFGFRWRRLLMGAAISEYSDSSAAALQFGWTI